MAEPTRDEEIKKIREEHPEMYAITLGVMIVGVLLVAGRLIYSDPIAKEEWGFGVNIYTSILGSAVTVLIINRLNRQRDKQKLVDDAASNSNEFAKNAIHQLRRKGQLTGQNGLLEEADLQSANLESVYLNEANLRKANLRGANLQRASLGSADLRNATLTLANLREASLVDANIREASLVNAIMYRTILLGANLRFANLDMANLEKALMIAANLNRATFRFANLTEADLSLTNLQKVDFQSSILRGTNFTGADCEDAKFDTRFFDESTILPDGTYWTTGTDMTRFTDPNHPNFWRSDDPGSPAYRGDPET